MTRTQTQYLPEEQKKRLHPDFIANEQGYWRMRDQLLKQYLSKWVAVHQGQVVAVSQDVLDITDQVGKLGLHAYIAKVGEEDKLVFQVRRKDFSYDASYQPFALPRAEVTFSNYAQTHSKRCLDVIPDTGADLSVLPDGDCNDIDLFSSPYFTTQSRGVVGPGIITLVYRGYAEINGLRFPALIQALRGDGHEAG
jgi:hypothetical protein